MRKAPSHLIGLVFRFRNPPASMWSGILDIRAVLLADHRFRTNNYQSRLRENSKISTETKEKKRAELLFFQSKIHRSLRLALLEAFLFQCRAEKMLARDNQKNTFVLLDENIQARIRIQTLKKCP